MLTRSMTAKLIVALASEYLFADFLSEIEPKNKVWTVVPLFYEKIAIGSKWVFKNKKDEHVTRMEAIRIFLAFSTYINFKVYQIDVKSAFLNGKLKKEVYVKQPTGFESSEFHDFVCKLDKALYGLKQAPKAWYQSNPKESHLIAMKRILKYLKAEAGYVAAAGYCASILCIKSQLSDCDIHYNMVPIFCDNTSAIAIFNNPVLHSRTKHIDIRYHFIRDYILKEDIELHFIPTEYQLADIFTKPLDEPTFTRLKAELGMLNID
uniref:Retrovirus-related Pol polyprotein from transposon TNT 1-94 n=1 Tax=Tanacetum cinerariifolium TaxID=118510 RepID=A0A699KUV1_TANCI|nr:retrovirus-related Pol polyprotein from transposon TNT 1-94 [Tanacetum cinerariifolium]